MAFSLTDGLHVEAVDDGFLVLVPGRGEAAHLEGPDAEAFRLARDGVDIVPESSERSMAGLIELGIVRTDTWSRRRVIQLGGAAAAAAVAVFALPSVAAAVSGGGTVPPPTTGSVYVKINLLDGLKDSASSPLRLPDTGTVTAYLYATADTSTPVASVGVFLPAGQTYVDYTFTGVAPGPYFVDIQQPFQDLGTGGLTIGTPPNTATYYIDWNYGNRSVQPGYPAPVDRFQPVTVTAGATSTVEPTTPTPHTPPYLPGVQVAVETTPPPWP